MSALLATLEAACLALHAPPTDAQAQQKRLEAEAVLEHFKRSPDALADATALVRTGTPAVVLFHCVATVREVTLKKWPVLSPQERSQPMDLLMQFLWQHYAQLPPFVAGALLQTVVLLMKRGWLERAPAERHAIVQQMGTMMGAVHPQDEVAAAAGASASSASIVRRLVAAKWILAFVTEFSSASRSSAMFQPVEFHTEARKTLRRGGLKELLGFAIQLQQDLIQTTTMCSTQDGHLIDVPKAQLELLETAFSLVVEILNWDFADSLGNLAWSLSANDAGSEESRTTISPDESWRDVLVRPELIHSAFNTYAFFRNLKNKNDNLLHLARQFLIQLASLRGPLFHSRNEKVQFLSEIFRGTSAIVHDPFLNMVAKNDYAAYEIATREMIDMCQLLFRIVNNLGLQAFAVGAPPELFQSFLNELSSLSCTLLASALEKIRAHLQRQSNEPVEDLWQLEGVDLLLDAWVSLINDSYLDTFAPASEPLGKEAQMISDALSQYSAPVVDLYLQVQLELCAVNALAEKDEDEDIEDNSAAGAREQFELAAALARMNASSSSSVLLKLLQGMLGETQQCLTAMQGREEITPQLGQLYEKVHFLVEFTGLFLADDFKSERPRIPTRIHRVFFSTSSSGSDAPGTDIINLLLLVVSQFLQFEATRVAQNPNNQAISPFVSEQILATTTRLCVTYLAPDVAIEGETGIAPLLLQVFGLHNGGRAGELIQFLVQQCTVYLIHWPTQPIVMENLMDFLLELSKSKAMSTVLESPFWQSIIHANGAAGTIMTTRTASGDPLLAAVARIPSSLRGQLAEALCRAGMTSDDEALRRAYFDAIASPVTNRFQQLVATPHFDSSQSVNDPRVQEELKLIVELYSGIARSAEAKNHGLISAFSLPVLPVMVKVFDLFHGEAQIVYLLLRFFCLLVEAQISYLRPKDALLVYTACHELIRSYSHRNLGKKDAFADSEEDSYTDLLALLQLLSHLISKDFIDFSDASAESKDVEQATVFVADVVFAGLSQVIPLMTESLLQYPGLSKQYFTLVTYMIDVYAEKLAGLDARLLGMLLHSLLFGIRHVQVDVARYSFQAIGELAGYHMKARQRNELGLQNHVDANPELFVHFIRVILRMALFEDFNPVILDACAGALYPLILIERERYFAIAEELRIEQTDPVVQERLMRAFRALTSFLKPGDLAMGTVATRKFRLLFKSHLFRFVADVRGFIQVK